MNIGTEIPSHGDIINAINTIEDTIQQEDESFNNYNSPHDEPVDMFNVIQNLNTISQENDDQEICTVCQDILDNGEQVHYLPECNHGYHTNCILTWFRTGNNNCPCCGNRGINYSEPKTSRQISRLGWGWELHRKRKNPNYIKLRAYSLRKDAPKQLKEFVGKLKTAEKELLDFVKAFKDGANEREYMSYKDVTVIVRDFHTKRRRMQEKISNYVSSIIDYPIVPLIIPVRKYITN